MHSFYYSCTVFKSTFFFYQFYQFIKYVIVSSKIPVLSRFFGILLFISGSIAYIAFLHSFTLLISSSLGVTVKDYTTKKIIHSLTTHTPCFIHYRARRYKCPVCNKTFYEHNPFAYKNMKISSLTVYNVLSDLKKATKTFKTVSDRYHISPTTTVAIFDVHVSISRRALPCYL